VVEAWVKIRAKITERILREAGFENQVTTAVAAIEKPSPALLAQGIQQSFQQEPNRERRDHIEVIACELTKPEEAIR
jgi:hypothetical protein